MEKGSYSLFIRLDEERKIRIGSLGEITFLKGFYAYNGSAFGPGGFKRVNRHKKMLKGQGNTHWHIDYLLSSLQASFVGVIKSDGDIECDLSRVDEDKVDLIDNFGCSDCKCGSHLLFSENLALLKEILLNKHERCSETVQTQFE